MFTVFICDDNANWLNVLRKGIHNDADFEVIGSADTGGDAIRFIENKRPDIIILDIIIPEHDGVYIVNHVRKQMTGYHPIIYIISGIGTDTVINLLNNMYIDYYSLKPVKLETILLNLKSIMKTRSEHSEALPDDKPPLSTEEHVKAVLSELGLHPYKISTKCVLSAVVYYLENPDANRVLTKIIYPVIAEKYNLSDSSVEKNIRKASASARAENTPLYRTICAHAADAKMTNNEFLLSVSNHIHRLMEAHDDQPLSPSAMSE